MSKPPLDLTEPQAHAILSAIGEIQAGETEHWPAPHWRALLNAETKIAGWLGLDAGQATAAVGEVNLAGLAEVASLASEHYGRTISRKRAWELSKHPKFPAPVQDLAMGPVWLESEVLAFFEIPRPSGRRPS